MKTVEKNSSKNESKQINKEELEKKKIYSEEKLKNLEQERQKRIKNEKISEKENQKIYEEILEEAKKKNFKMNIRKDDSIPLKTNIKISEKKAQNILEEGGMLDAYKYLIIQLCKNGLPTGNLFEYSAYVIKNYEKKWKEKKSKINKENIEKYWEQKEKDFKEKIEKNKNNLKEIKKLNRSLDEIEMKKYIKDLDRSRSSRGIKPLREKIVEKVDNNKYVPSTFRKKNKSSNKSNINNNANKEKKQNENSKNYTKKESKISNK